MADAQSPNALNRIEPPLIRQARRFHLTDDATLDDAAERIASKRWVYDEHFAQPLGRRDPHGDRHPETLDDFDYAVSPAWMIALSERFGRRYLTSEQRWKLLAAAPETLWKDALIAAERRYESVYGHGGTKEFGCNQEYAFLLKTAWGVFDCGGRDLLCSFLQFFRYSVEARGYLSIDRDGFSFRTDGISSSRTDE